MVHTMLKRRQCTGRPDPQSRLMLLPVLPVVCWLFVICMKPQYFHAYTPDSNGGNTGTCRSCYCHAFTTQYNNIIRNTARPTKWTRRKIISSFATTNERSDDTTVQTTTASEMSTTSSTTTTTTILPMIDPLSALATPTLSPSSSSNSSIIGSTRSSTTLNDSNVATLSDRWMGLVVLFTVPLAWGTYTPVVKYLYTIQPPVPGLIFSAAYYVVAAISLWMILLIQQQQSSWYTTDIMKENDVDSVVPFTIKDSPIAKSAGVVTVYATSSGIQQQQQQQSSLLSLHSPNDYSDYWYGGMELGMYLFIANVLQVIGLQTIPADRAGFLVQLTTIFVPLFEGALIHFGNNRLDNERSASIPQRTWIACGLAFTGVVVFDMNFDEFMQHIPTTTITMTKSDNFISPISALSLNLPNMMLNSIGQVSNGDYLIIMAAVLYSLHVVRLGRYAKVCNALPLAASKATAEAILSTGLVLVLTLFVDNDNLVATTTTNGLTNYITEAGHDINSFMTSMSTILSSNNPIHDDNSIKMILPALGAIFWTGWVTCAYTIFAQSYGQSRVQPTEANLIYSIQPLCTALFAFTLLGETLSPSGIIGASFIATAIYSVAVTDENKLSAN